jgi:Outer membrane protein beta-barrel domain
LVSLRFTTIKKMKRIALLLILISFKVDAQEHFNWGLKEGMSRSLLSADTYTGLIKSGFVGGAFVKGRLGRNWTTALEIMYVEKGSRHRSDSNNGDFNSYFLQLNYLEIPVLFQYNIKRLGIHFGPGYGLLLKTNEIMTIDGKDVANPKPFNKNELNFNIGLNYSFKSRFGLSFRYTNSLAPVRKLNPGESKWYKYGQKNTVLVICLTYEFGKGGSGWK